MSASFEPDRIELKGLAQLAKALKRDPPVIKVGILGNHASRKKSNGGPNNAEIGATHEYGAPSQGLPARSFLRMPLGVHLPKELERAGLFTQEEAKEVIRQGSLLPWARIVSKMAVATVRRAFQTGGFGTWKEWSKGYTNKTGMILVDTTQLRDSIDSEVKNK